MKNESLSNQSSKKSNKLPLAEILWVFVAVVASCGVAFIVTPPLALAMVASVCHPLLGNKCSLDEWGLELVSVGFIVIAATTMGLALHVLAKFKRL